MIIETGRVCIKIVGREAGRKCAIVEVLDKNFVTIVGQGIRRRKCNIRHLEPLNEKIKIKKGAKDADIVKSLK